MTLLDHLAELRTRLFIALGAWIVAAGVCFGFRFRLLAWLQAPLPEAMTLNYFSILEPFVTSMQIASFFGLVLAAPVLVGQLWGFLAPGLYADERRYAVPFILLSAGAFVTGVAFAYFVVLPMTLPILLGFLGEQATGVLSIGRYIGNVLMLMALFGIMFEMPVLAYLLARLGLIRHEAMVRTRRYAIVIGLVAAALLSPTGDPFNFALVAIPLVILYELSILVVRASQRKEPHGTQDPNSS